MPRFWCRAAEELPNEAIAQEAIDAEEAAISFAENWDRSCGDRPILDDEYPDGFSVIVTQSAEEQHNEDCWSKFLVSGELVPYYSAQSV